MNIHFLENETGVALAVAATAAALPKIAGAKRRSVALTAGQMLMLEDGAPLICFLTTEQRAAYWKANPPKSVRFASAIKAREDALKAQRAAILEAERASVVKKKVVVPQEPAIDRTNMRWDMTRCKYVEDKFAALAGDVVKNSEPPADAPSADSFQLKHGPNAETMIKIIAKENPRKIGTKAHDKWNEMVKFIKKNPKATLQDIFSGTNYQKNDVAWDLAKKSIKLIPIVNGDVK